MLKRFFMLALTVLFLACSGDNKEKATAEEKKEISNVDSVSNEMNDLQGEIATKKAELDELLNEIESEEE